MYPNLLLAPLEGLQGKKGQVLPYFWGVPLRSTKKVLRGYNNLGETLGTHPYPYLEIFE